MFVCQTIKTHSKRDSCVGVHQQGNVCRNPGREAHLVVCLLQTPEETALIRKTEEYVPKPLPSNSTSGVGCYAYTRNNPQLLTWDYLLKLCQKCLRTPSISIALCIHQQDADGAPHIEPST